MSAFKKNKTRIIQLIQTKLDLLLLTVVPVVIHHSGIVSAAGVHLHAEGIVVLYLLHRTSVVHDSPRVAKMVRQKVFMNKRTAVGKDPALLGLDEFDSSVLILDAVHILRHSCTMCLSQLLPRSIVGIHQRLRTFHKPLG